MKKHFLLILSIFLISSCFSQGWIGAGGSIYPVDSTLALTPLNVGIGTDAPTAQFHTTGTVRFEGLTSNNALTNVVVADANGNLFLRDVSTLNNLLLTNNGAFFNEVVTLKKEVADLKNQVQQLMKVVNQRNLFTSDNLKKEFLIYPNPAKNVIKISALTDSPFGSRKVTLQNMDGKIINTFSITNALSMPTTNVAAGIYLISIYDNNNLLQSEKVVVK